MYNVPKNYPELSTCKFYDRVRVSNNIASVHLPRRDVFYVRFKLFEDTGIWYNLEHVEISMWLEGMLPLNEITAIPKWYVEKFMGGVEVDFRHIKEQVKNKIAKLKKEDVPESAELAASHYDT